MVAGVEGFGSGTSMTTKTHTGKLTVQVGNDLPCMLDDDAASLPLLRLLRVDGVAGGTNRRGRGTNGDE